MLVESKSIFMLISFHSEIWDEQLSKKGEADGPQ